MGAYTSCTIYCDTRRVNGTLDDPYKYRCGNELTWAGINHCLNKMSALCTGGLEVVKSATGSGNERYLKCPSRGLSEREFISILCSVFLLALVLIGACQYTVGWAFIKERDIYKRLAGFSFKKCKPPPQMLPVITEPMTTSKQTVILSEIEAAQKLDQIYNDPTMLAVVPVGPITTPSVQQVEKVIIAGVEIQEIVEFEGNKVEKIKKASTEAVVDEEGNSSPWKASSKGTVDSDRRLINDLGQETLPELKPLRKLEWLACWCQMTVVVSWILLISFLLYMFIYYKPKVEMDAKVPIEGASVQRRYYIG